MYAHFLRQELPEYFALNQAIHDAIMRASGNPVLAATYNALAARLTRARYMSNRMRPDRWKAAMDEHATILELLLARDGVRLGPLLARHLQNKREIIIEALERSSA
jgi:DNA-binding GntR family transcriptional regulator